MNGSGTRDEAYSHTHVAFFLCFMFFYAIEKHWLYALITDKRNAFIDSSRIHHLYVPIPSLFPYSSSFRGNQVYIEALV